MPILSAENKFRQGLTALVDNDPASAAVHFHTAMQIERQRAVARPQTRYLSYYGLSVALSQGATPEALRACETAARLDFFNPDLLLNLGRVYQLAGKATRALDAFERGLKLAPAHPALRAELRKADRRTRPPLSVVPRQHPINRALGKLRAAVKTRNPRYVMPSTST